MLRDKAQRKKTIKPPLEEKKDAMNATVQVIATTIARLR